MFEEATPMSMICDTVDFTVRTILPFSICGNEKKKCIFRYSRILIRVKEEMSLGF